MTRAMQHRKPPSLIAACLLVCFAHVGKSHADQTARALSKLEGFTILAVTQIDGEFNGCDWDRPVKLKNGLVLKCRTYSYSYSYSPDAVVFAKRFEYQGKKLAEIRLLVEGEVYDMGMEVLK